MQSTKTNRSTSPSLHSTDTSTEAANAHKFTSPSRKKSSPLASSLAALASLDGKLETTASSLLSILASSNIRDLSSFSIAIQLAYEENGWHSRPGKPSPSRASEDRRAVPHTVRTYVWEIRSALRSNLPVWEYPTFHALRLARKEAQQELVPSSPTPAAANTEDIPPTDDTSDALLADLTVRKPNRLTGSLIHDLSVTLLHLPDDEQEELTRSLTRLLQKFSRLLNLPSSP